MNRHAGPPERTARPPGPLLSFARFVLCGGGLGLVAAVATVLLTAVLPLLLANAAVTVATTALGTELHARFTFGGVRRCTLRRHLASAGSAAASYGVTSSALLLLRLAQPTPEAWVEMAVHVSASGLAGTGRFFFLRLVVFPAPTASHGVTVLTAPVAEPAASAAPRPAQAVADRNAPLPLRVRTDLPHRRERASEQVG